MFWISLFCFAVAAAATVGALVSNSRDKSGFVLAIGGGIVLGLVFLIVSMASVVAPRNMGVVTSYKKPTGETTGAGLQWTKPWETVEDWSVTAEVYDHGNEKTCVSVRIAGGGQGCAELTVGWRAAVPRGPENFATYRPTKVGDNELSRFQVFEDRRVNKPITAEVQSMFTAFNPFEGVEAGKLTDGGMPPSPDLNGLFRQELTDRLNVAIGGGTKDATGKVTVQVDNPATKNEFEDDPEADVVILSVTFGFIRYDEQTNKRMAEFGTKLLENRTLLVDKANAQLRRDVASLSGMTPFQRECLDKGGVYAAFCGGGGSSIAIPAK